MSNLTTTQKLVVLFVLWLLLSGGKGCELTTTMKVTHVVYTYDDKSGGVPSEVAVAIDDLNKLGIAASLDEVDTMNADGKVPTQYEVSRPAAVTEGLPCVVSLGKGKVVRKLKDPKTKAQVFEIAGVKEQPK